MPAYGSVAPKTLTSGRPITVWDNETVGVAEASQSVGIHRSQLPNVVAIEIVFSGDPGVFEIDLQTADTDSVDFYVSKVAITQANLNVSFVCRVEASNIVSKFLRLLMVSFANTSTVTVNANIS